MPRDSSMVKRFFSLLLSLFYILIIQAVGPDFLKAEENPLPVETIRHKIKVEFYPEEHTFIAEDTVTVPKRLLPEFHFSLHEGLGYSSSEGAKIVKESIDNANRVFDSYKVNLPHGVNTFTIKYGGVINHPLEQYGKEQARGFRWTAGIISDEGVHLSGSSFWYPVFDIEMVSFDLQVVLPPGWDAVSQGERRDHRKDEKSTNVRWDSPEPQEEIFIVAGRFYEYNRAAGKLVAMAFLRNADKGLAEKYLDATVRNIAMYEELIGPYPYEKFALVENFWETGFGMPSFTLLGPKVIRLPFIINISYPHEILHNWWGNSVFPDYEKGNWSEGLTAYLSDYLFKEQQGEGVDYRLTTLQKYADYVISGRDFPLAEFRSRHSASAEAIGYGKSLMFFHMLRLELGDDVFIEGLRDFYQKNRFKVATFNDIRQSFERVSGRDLKEEFDRWITKPGAPQLRIKDVRTGAEGPEYTLYATIEQIQREPKYRLLIPVAVTVDGKERAYQTIVILDKERAGIKLDLPSRPLRIDVDPDFDLFRRLDRDEIPPAISQALGAKKMLVVLPSSADKQLTRAYREFADTLSKAGPEEVKTMSDNEISRLPSDRSVAIIGWENRFLDKMFAALSPLAMKNQNGVRVGKTEIPFKNNSVVLTAKNPEDKDFAMMSIASDQPDALSGLGRKLPHYHKYSYLVFEGSEPANIAKGRWPVLDSPMTVHIPDLNGKISRVEMGKLEQRRPLIAVKDDFSTERMMETIKFLSDVDLKGRGLGTEELDRAAEYIAEKFREAGLKPAGDEEGSFFQAWEDQVGNNPERKIRIKNVVGVIPGWEKADWAGQSVIVGAHYDHLGIIKGQIHPGADDNASGISVLIELAMKLGKRLKPDRSVIFAAFTGEETGKKGSKHYVKTMKRYPVAQSIGMVNLDTVGRLGKNKLLVLGAGSAAEWPQIFKEASYVAGIEIESVSEELDSSDQKSLQETGVPAVQLFTGPHLDYHRPTDTLDKIDSGGLVKVASAAKEVIEYLAGRQEPLTTTISVEGKSETVQKKERKVSLGIIPDFAFAGEGCRVSGIVQGSPAEKAGLKEGDIVIGINSRVIKKLKDLSDALKSLNPGDKVSITFLREGKKLSAKAGLTTR